MNLTFGVSVLVKAFIDSKAATENMKNFKSFHNFLKNRIGKIGVLSHKKDGYPENISGFRM